MKRIVLLVVVLAVFAPLTGGAAPPRPGICPQVPMMGGQCSYKASLAGTIVFAIQGAVEFRVQNATSYSRNCYFGTGGGTGPRVAKGDTVTIIKRTSTTTLLAVQVPGRTKYSLRTTHPFAC